MKTSYKGHEISVRPVGVNFRSNYRSGSSSGRVPGISRNQEQAVKRAKVCIDIKQQRSK